jgi:dinuclear metal center YbgI/SA1388 family protein
MTKIAEICQYLNQYAPTAIAEAWDNVGLLVGDSQQAVDNIMTCLTVTPESVAEAVDQSAQLIVSHHPILFDPVRRVTAETTTGQLLIDLIRGGVAVYSPHTGFDSAVNGINQMIARRLSLENIAPLNPFDDDSSSPGSGRYGHLPKPVELDEFAAELKKHFSLQGLHVVGDTTDAVDKIAIACGSGGSFLHRAIELRCDTMLSGETNFHTCLEAKARGIRLILIGHFASERFAVEHLADELASVYPDLNCWASLRESDPVQWL